MSPDDSMPEPASRNRRGAVREKAQQVRQRQSRARMARIAALTLVGAGVVVAIVVVIATMIAPDVTKPELAPKNTVDDGFVITDVSGVALDGAGAAGPTDETAADTDVNAVGDGSSEQTQATPDPESTEKPKVDIRIYVDYLSTGSRDFQLANASQLSKWVTEGAATLSYHPIAMLTAKSSGTKYSLRAAGAAACVATNSPDAFFAFNNALLTEQPDVDTEGYTDSELADLAIASGASNPKVVRSCIEKQEYQEWAKDATERALDGLSDTDLALTGTPMVLVNDSAYIGALDDPAEFAQFVLSIDSDAYYKPSPTPTPERTPSPTP